MYPPPDVKFDPPFIKEPRRPLSILELGSGAGMASSRIANVLDLPEDLLIVTDLPEVCPSTIYKMDHNKLVSKGLHIAGE